MIKDLIGNVLAKGDKVHVQLVNPQLFGFIAEIKEPPLVALRGRASMEPGHILISCVIAVPIDPTLDGVPQLAKVYDAMRVEGPSLVEAQPN